MGPRLSRASSASLWPSAEERLREASASTDSTRTCCRGDRRAIRRAAQHQRDSRGSFLCGALPVAIPGTGPAGVLRTSNRAPGPIVLGQAKTHSPGANERRLRPGGRSPWTDFAKRLVAWGRNPTLKLAGSTELNRGDPPHAPPIHQRITEHMQLRGERPQAGATRQSIPCFHSPRGCR